MDFNKAVKQLVEAHAREIKDLQKQLPGGSRKSNQKNHGAKDISGFLPIEESQASNPERMHGFPLRTPVIKGVGATQRKVPHTPRTSTTVVQDMSRGSLYSVCSWDTANTDFDIPRGLLAPGDTPHSSKGDTVNCGSRDGSDTKNSSVNQATEDESSISASDRGEAVYHRWKTLIEALLTRPKIVFEIHTGWSSPMRPLQSSQTDEILVSVVSDPVQRAVYKEELRANQTKADALGKLKKRYTGGSLSRGRGFISHPASKNRQCWAILSFLIIMYEIIAITMTPFDIIEGTIPMTIEWISAVFWILDVTFCFSTGYYADGKVELRFSMIAIHYVKSWFFFDVIIASSQLCALIVNNDNLNATFFLKVLRASRSLRLARFFYWLKEKWGLSSSSIAGGKMLQFVFVLILFIHCNACIWYEVGKSDNGWHSEYSDRLTDSAGQNYLVSLHWSLSQLQGNVDIYPGKSSSDRLFAVLSSTCSIVALTFFVSSMTDTLFDARQHFKNRLAHERLMKGFFSRHPDIGPEFRARANFCLELNLKQQSELDENAQDQEALRVFPPALRQHLLAEMHAFVLIWQPMFHFLQRYHRNQFAKICTKVLAQHTYEPNDDVFTKGEVSGCAYFVSQGDLVLNVPFDLSAKMAPWLQSKPRNRGRDLKTEPKQIVMSRTLSTTSGTSQVSVDSEKFATHIRPVQRITKRDVASEASLWMAWKHVGDLCAVEHSQIFSISTFELIRALGQHPISYGVFSAYAVRFVSAAEYIRSVKHTAAEVELMTFQTVLDFEEASVPA